MKKMAFDHYDLLYCFFFSVCVICALGQVWRKVCIYSFFSSDDEHPTDFFPFDLQSIPRFYKP